MRWLLVLMLIVLGIPVQAIPVLERLPASELQRARPKPVALPYTIVSGQAFRFNTVRVHSDHPEYLPGIQSYAETFNRIVGRPVIRLAPDPQIVLVPHTALKSYDSLYGLTVYTRLDARDPRIDIKLAPHLSRYPTILAGTIWHELSHAMGFDHATRRESLLHPRSPVILKLEFSPEEIRDIRFLYNYKR